MQQTCPRCGALVRTNARFCGTCGYTIPAPTTFSAVAVAAPPAAARPYLVSANGQQYPLPGPVTRIGRGAGCGVQLADGSVSGAHAEIETQGARTVVRDIGSRNGTFVNGVKAAGDALLNSGDQVAFGEAAFVFCDGLPAGRAVPETRAMAVSAPPSFSGLAVPQPFPAPLAGPSAAPPAALPVLRDWGPRPPDVEGRVVFVDGPHKEQKGSVAQTAVAAGCLAFIAAPLVFIPFLFNKDVSVFYLRVEDIHTGEQRQVKLRGEPSGLVGQGDVAAFWGRLDGGTLLVRSAYNYNTNSYVKVK